MSGRRVLVVTNMWPGERSVYAGIFVQRQVAALRRAAPDWTFDVFTMAGHRGRADYLWAVPRLRRRLREGYDLVHAHYGLSGATAALAGAHPLITTFHGCDVNLGWQRPISRFAGWRSVAAVVVSERLRAAWGRPAPVVPCGVPTELFRPLGRREARERLGIPAGARVVLFPADPEIPVKGYRLFEAAMGRLPSEMRDRLVVRTMVEIPPEEAPWHMAAADVVVVTSVRESGPLVVKEALAVGVPVVGVDVGDVAETLEGLEGSRVVPRRADAVAEAVAEVLEGGGRGTDPSELRQRVFDLGLDDDAIAARLLDVYRGVLSAGV